MCLIRFYKNFANVYPDFWQFDKYCKLSLKDDNIINDCQEMFFGISRFCNTQRMILLQLIPITECDTVNDI